MSNAVGIEISTADGRTVRCAPDEPDAWAVPFAVTYSSTMPGGHDQCSFSLRVRIDREVPFSLLDDVRVVGPGNVTLWRGMVAKMPRQSGDDFLMNVQCVGHSARLKWDTGFRERYVDRQIGNWTELPLSIRASLATAGLPQGKIPVSVGQPDGIVWSPPNESIPQNEISEAYYDLAGMEVGAFTYKGKRQGAWTNFEAPTLFHRGGGSLGSLTLDDTVRSMTPSGTAFGGLRLRAFLSGGSSTPAAGHLQSYSEVGVYGTHGVTGVWLADGHYGYYGHAVLADVLARAAPAISFTTGPDGSIVDNTGFIIPQLAFLTPTTAEDAILEINKYFEWEWGMWDEFFWRPADPDRLCWDARLDQGIYLGLEGDDADNCVNGFLVTYNLPDGTTKTAGPLGSGCDVEDALLGDSDPLNIVNAQGIEAKYGKDTLSTVTTDEGAVQFGFAKMAELSLPARKGQITLTGTIEHPTKGPRPVSEVRAGDWVRISDHPADVPRRIIKASHSPDERRCEIDVGADVPKVDAMIAEVEAYVRAAGF